MQLIKNIIIDIDGTPINTLQAGEFAGPTLLFLHGKAFQAKTWLDLGTLQAAVDAGYSILALDLPGFGKSPEATVAPEQVINELMQSAGIEKAIVVGPSMGGKIALEFSLDNPEKIAGLVLIGAVGVEENRDRLSQLPPSSLIVWGEKDHISDPANGVLLHESIPGATLVVFEGAKHPCYLEQPELWHKTLLNFAQTVQF
ncbi:MAG: alpha/beta hydrolase [Desulfocapsa sp.]|nr:alpha/beta hydrolase [Desulfocapsa sp.]